MGDGSNEVIRELCAVSDCIFCEEMMTKATVTTTFGSNVCIAILRSCSLY